MSLHDLYRQYRDRVEFLVIYIREAHPVDGWWLGGGITGQLTTAIVSGGITGQLPKAAIDVYDPKTIEERQAVARKYASHVANCPFLVDGSCGACIERCPAGAITAQGHDKNKCRENIDVTQKHWLEKPGYIGTYAGCGLCQTKVPCESRIPKIKTIE